MIEVTVVDEISVPLDRDNVLKLNDVRSMQNRSGQDIHWSTIPFSSTNLGAILRGEDELVFSAPRTVYVNEAKQEGHIHCRNVVL